MRLGRKIKIIFLSLVGIFLTLLLAVVIAVVWAAKNPREAFALAERHLLPEDLTIKWEQMAFTTQKGSWRHWEVAWSTENLVLEKGSPELRLPIEQASLAFALRVFEDGPWLHFESLKAKTGAKAYFKSTAAEPEESAAQSPFEQLQNYLGYLQTATKWVSVDNMQIEVPGFNLISADGKAVITLQAKLTKPAGKDDSRATDFVASITSGESKTAIKGWIDATLLDSAENFTVLSVVAGGKSWKAETELAGRYQNEAAVFEGHSDISYISGSKTIRARPRLQLTLSQTGAELDVESAVRDIPGPLVKLDKLKIEVRVPFDKGYAWSERPATFKAWGPVELFFVDKDMRPPLEKSCRCKIPETLMVILEGRSWLQSLLGKPEKQTTVVDSKISVEGMDNKLLTVNLAAHVKINKLREQWIVEPRLDSELTIQSFQGMRQFLDARGVIIPSPLDILDGKISVSAKGAVDHDDKLIRSAVDVKVDLGSRTQKVLIESTINLNLARDFKGMNVYLHSLLRQVRIELPPIDPVRGIPSVTTDRRLVFKPEKPVKRSDFKLRIFFDVQTAGPGAVQLLSNMADPYVPVTIDINNSNKGESAGMVRLEPFTISYLRRKVHVERLQVTLAEDEDGDFPIGGRFRVDQTNYKVYVDIAGTLSAPIVNLNSEPFLPREDIISVLLFDRVNDQLVSTDADTAGGVQAALADRAIGLFGLWAFASTPIRSFSYNAVTKVYTATLQLADGLTAGVGTNWEQAAHLEVRKRVSRRWVLTASWSPTAEQEQVGQLVLQWEKRF